MPVVLMQHFLESDRPYKDVEGSLYHYPPQYFTRIQAYEPFVYYRPLGESIPRADSKTYFGHGVIGVPYPDYLRANHWYAPLIAYQPFPHIVPAIDPLGNFYETGTNTKPAWQAAVRNISEISYHRILAAAGVAVTGVSLLQTTEQLMSVGYHGDPVSFPKDPLREGTGVPEGAGYVPRGNAPPNIYDSASLHERARQDHQLVLKAIEQKVIARKGKWWYNNHIDMFAELADLRLLIEAKSLTNQREAVDRMRYGIGQLTDYSIRYESETAGARKVLAFGTSPSRDASWIRSILQDAGIAMFSLDNGELVALNGRAEELAHSL